MRFIAGLVIGAIGVLAYQKKDELKKSAACLKDKTLDSVKSCCTQTEKTATKKAKKA